MKEISALRLKTCNYLTDDKDENNEEKCTKKCAKERKLTFEDYKHYLEVTQIENEINQPEKINLM